MNYYQFKIVKLQGASSFGTDHKETDETFIVMASGVLRIDNFAMVRLACVWQARCSYVPKAR